MPDAAEGFMFGNEVEMQELGRTRVNSAGLSPAWLWRRGPRTVLFNLPSGVSANILEAVHTSCFLHGCAVAGLEKPPHDGKYSAVWRCWTLLASEYHRRDSTKGDKYIFMGRWGGETKERERGRQREERGRGRETSLGSICIKEIKMENKNCRGCGKDSLKKTVSFSVELEFTWKPRLEMRESAAPSW